MNPGASRSTHYGFRPSPANDDLEIVLTPPTGGPTSLRVSLGDLFASVDPTDDLLAQAHRNLEAECRRLRFRLPPLGEQQARALNAAITAYTLNRPVRGAIELPVQLLGDPPQNVTLRQLRDELDAPTVHILCIPVTQDDYRAITAAVGNLAAETGYLLHQWSDGAPVHPALPPAPPPTTATTARASGLGAALVPVVEQFSRLSGAKRLLLLHMVHVHVALDTTVTGALMRAADQSAAGTTILLLVPADQPPFVPGMRTLALAGLPSFVEDWTELARGDRLARPDGRTREIQEIVGRLTADGTGPHSVALLGRAGVGKTSLARAVAFRLIEPAFAGWRLLNVRLSALQADTHLQGALEGRVEQWIALAGEPLTICFLDEFHRTAASATEGTAARSLLDHLKEPLASGHMRLLAATTDEEWRRMHLDAAIERRFLCITIPEPSVEAAAEMLSSAADEIAEAHHRPISGDMVRYAAQQASRYLPGLALPASADRLLREAVGLAEPGHAVTATVIDAAVAKLSNAIVPGTELARRLITAEACLAEQVIGQPYAVHAVARQLRSAAVYPPNGRGRPVASFLFAGPTGVGKTELAQQISRLLWDEDRALIIDMGQFQEPHQAAHLLGAPPGYIGYDEGGRLSNFIQDRGACVVVFDEAEKAHPRIWDTLLGILDRGEATDGRGRSVDFRRSVVVLTTNLLSDEVAGALQDGRCAAQGEESVFFQACDAEAVRFAEIAVQLGSFRREFLNRIDAIVPFGRLEGAVVEHLLDRYVDETNTKLAERWEVRLRLSAALRRKVVQEGFSPTYGARGLRRAFERVVTHALDQALLSGQLPKNTSVVADLGLGNQTVLLRSPGDGVTP